MKWVKLEDVAEINPKKSEIDKNIIDYVSFVAMADVSEDGFISRSEARPLSEVYSSYTYFKKGDVLLAKITPCFENGKAAVADNISTEIGFGSSEFHVIRAKSRVIPKYLFYLLWNEPFRKHASKKMTGSAGQKRVPTSFLRSYEIPLPNLAEQKAIVAKLDRAQRLIDIDRQMLTKYDELIQSVFLEMFGDINGDKVSLSELVIMNPRKSEISGLDKSLEVTFLGMAEVGENGSLDLFNVETIEKCWNGYTYFREDDVLFAKITPCMENGKGAIAKGLKNALGFGSTEFHVLRPIEGVSRSAWIYHLTHSDKFRKIAKTFMTGSAGQKRVPTHFFNRFKVVTPLLEKQVQFEEIATEISDEKEKLRRQLKKSQNLFSSLLQEAFG